MWIHPFNCSVKVGHEKQAERLLQHSIIDTPLTHHTATSIPKIQRVQQVQWIRACLTYTEEAGLDTRTKQNQSINKHSQGEKMMGNKYYKFNSFYQLVINVHRGNSQLGKFLRCREMPGQRIQRPQTSQQQPWLGSNGWEQLEWVGMQPHLQECKWSRGDKLLYEARCLMMFQFETMRHCHWSLVYVNIPGVHGIDTEAIELFSNFNILIRT